MYVCTYGMEREKRWREIRVSHLHMFFFQRGLKASQPRWGGFFLVFAMYLIIRDVWGSLLYLHVPCKTSTE